MNQNNKRDDMPILRVVDSDSKLESIGVALAAAATEEAESLAEAQEEWDEMVRTRSGTAVRASS